MKVHFGFLVKDRSANQADLIFDLALLPPRAGVQATGSTR
jgi:hypothetical protein